MKLGKYSCLITATVILLLLPFSLSVAQKTLTVAESSNFTATSRYADVMEFIKALQRQSPFIRVETLCTSTESREVPLLVIGNPVPSSPLDLKYDDRTVVYIQANIHAGEVEGKEATLMLARDILLNGYSDFLKDFVILIVPILNADGNEKLGKNRRDNGPELAGIRYNGQNLDLNRDGIKLESPEIQGLVQNVLNRWDPVLLVDCHTTNGDYHEEPVTYGWPVNPNGDRAIIQYMRDAMMPSVDALLQKKYKTLSIPYGDFVDWTDPGKGWQSSGPEPHYITNYVGLRNRLSILLENYAYADFKTRVWGNYYFLLSLLEYCQAHKKEILELVRNADVNTIQRGLRMSSADSFAVEFELQPLTRNVTILGYEMESYQDQNERIRPKKTDRKRTYTVPLLYDWVAKRSVRLPFGYLISVPDTRVLEVLIRHGILVEKLTEPATLPVESFQVIGLQAVERPYQGHYTNSVKGEYSVTEKTFPIGTYFIPMAQPLGTLAASLLEPESDDGLLVWNFFDRYLVAQWGREPQTYPVYKLLKPATLAKQTVK